MSNHDEGPGDVADSATAERTGTADLWLAGARVEDFRVLDDVHVEFSRPLTLLVGENNAGKTALLAALQCSFQRSSSNEDDLRVDSDGSRAERFVVDLRFEPSPDDGFPQEIRDLLGNALRPPAPPDLPREHAVLRTEGRLEAGGRIGYAQRFLNRWASDRNEAAGVSAVPNTPVRREFLDLFEFSLLDAARDLQRDRERRTSPWGRLLAELDIPEADRAQIEQALEGVGLQVLEQSPVLQQLRQALRRLEAALPAGVSTVDLAPLPPHVEELGRNVDVVVSAPQGARLPVRQQGSGGRSLTSLLSFRAFVEARLGAGRRILPLAVSGFEEPEAHLHPHAQKSALAQIAAMPGQHVVTTHSPSVAATAEIEAVRRLTRHRGSIDIHRLDPDKSAQERLHVRRWLLRRDAEALFSRLVLLVEGETDESALAPLARVFWAPQDPAGHGLSIVDATGAKNVANVAGALSDFGIPWVALFDGDPGGQEGRERLWPELERLSAAEEDHVVVLPADVDFEQYLLDERFREPVLRALDQLLGEDAVPGDIADEELVGRMRNTKGSFGAIMAEEIAVQIDQDRERLPSKLRDLFQLVHQHLGGGS